MVAEAQQIVPVRVAKWSVLGPFANENVSLTEHHDLLAVLLLELAQLAHRHRKPIAVVRKVDQNDLMSVDLVNLRHHMDLALDVPPDRVAQPGTVEASSISDSADRKRQGAVVIDADQDVAARRSVAHRDRVLDEVQLVPLGR